MFHAVKSRWHSPSGYKEVLVLAIPLVITTSAGSLQSFIDRMFLSWFDPNALAATVPATLVTMTLTAVFLGLAGYVGVFVTQYYGAREDARIGPMVWQGFYTTGLSLLVVVPVYIYIIPLFKLIGHDPILQVMEADYARILTLTIPIAIISASLSGFFSGIGRTSVVMWSNLLITLVNIILDYGLIFGHWGMPRMGVAGLHGLRLYLCCWALLHSCGCFLPLATGAPITLCLAGISTRCYFDACCTLVYRWAFNFKYRSWPGHYLSC